MELYLYVSIIRRHWPFVVAIPLVVALISLAVALARPPVYGLTVRLLVTRGEIDAGSRAGLTAGGDEDTTANDLPAIVSGAPFRHDLAQALAQRGHLLNETALAHAIGATNQQHLVTLAVSAAQPNDAVAIAQTAVALLQTNGLRYWNEPRATPAHPGLNVAVLDLPAAATRLNGPRTVAVEVGLRTLAGAVAGIALAFGLYYLNQRPAIREVMREA
jgi:uncharacterized protein involved in exopolysaccharide biosynthesis